MRFQVQEEARQCLQTSSTDTCKATKCVLNGRKSVRKEAMKLGILQLSLVNLITLREKEKTKWFGGNTPDTKLRQGKGIHNVPTWQAASTMAVSRFVPR